jgi:hypothetical protein
MKAEQVGSLPPILVVFLGNFRGLALSLSLVLEFDISMEGEELREDEGGEGNSYLRHLHACRTSPATEKYGGEFFGGSGSI